MGQHPELVRVLGSWLKRLATAPLCEDLLCDLIRVAATLSFSVLKESGISKILRNLPKWVTLQHAATPTPTHPG